MSTSTYIQDLPHLNAFVDAAAQSMADIPVEQVIIYLPQVVNATALDTLLKEWGVNLPGIGNSTDQVKRDMLDAALELHRFKGTARSIRKVFQVAGMPEIEILEKDDLDGYNQRYANSTFANGGGVAGPASAHWAQYAVRFILSATTQPIPNSLSQSMVDVLDLFAPARCELVWLAALTDDEDTIAITDDLTLTVI